MEKKLNVLVKDGKVNFLTKKERLIVLYSLVVACTATQVMGATGDAPWLGVMDKITKILVGPTARYMAILAFAGTGLYLMFGNLEAGAKKFFQILLGISIVFAAVSWGPKFMGYSGALLM